MASRPLSPHLSIWKWGPHMLVSILHRVSGDGMAFVGLPVLVWWLAALGGGAESYATFTGWMWADIGALPWSGGEILFSAIKAGLKLMTIGLTWALFSHICSGIRHFVLDAGAGYELDTNKAGSVLSIAAGIILTAAFWAALLLF